MNNNQLTGVSNSNNNNNNNSNNNNSNNNNNNNNNNKWNQESKEMILGEIMKSRKKKDGEMSRLEKHQAGVMLLMIIMPLKMRISQRIRGDKGRKDNKERHVLSVAKWAICLKIVQRIREERMFVLIVDKKDTCQKIVRNPQKNEGSGQ